jgi:hypothetical protein
MGHGTSHTLPYRVALANFQGMNALPSFSSLLMLKQICLIPEIAHQGRLAPLSPSTSSLSPLSARFLPSYPGFVRDLNARLS